MPYLICIIIIYLSQRLSFVEHAASQQFLKLNDIWDSQWLT